MNEKTRTINVAHLGRVEGHGGIFVKVVGDRVQEVNLEVSEGSRHYETLLLGKHFMEVQGIITRVCAICSANHTVAALTALENALGISCAEQTHRLRGLLLLGATIESHALHVFALALPDFFGCDSLITLAAKHPREAAFGLKLKQLGNRIQQIIGGRAVHPINTIVGGFGKVPSHAQLEGIKSQLQAALDPLMEFINFAATLDVPDYAAQPTIYLALRPYEQAYRFRGGSICTSRGEEYPVSAYRDVVREFMVDHSRAKHAAMASGESYVVGSLARLSLWGHFLRGRSREAFDLLFPNGTEDNILLNNWAQLVELVHCIERGVEVCDILLSSPEAKCEIPEYEVREGRGIGAIEVPRGTLFHEYAIDSRGFVVEANVITPTAQNLANVERDMRTSLERLLLEGAKDRDQAQLRLKLAMVARAYDPCISCSVHLLCIDA